MKRVTLHTAGRTDIIFVCDDARWRSTDGNFQMVFSQSTLIRISQVQAWLCSLIENIQSLSTDRTFVLEQSPVTMNARYKFNLKPDVTVSIQESMDYT